jgi:hypothetical protein
LNNLGRSISPAPTNYDLKSAFNKASPEGKAYTFGVSRDAYKKVSSIFSVYVDSIWRLAECLIRQYLDQVNIMQALI